MSAKKIVGIVVSSVFVFALGFCIVWAVINFDAIKYAMSGTALYTKQDLEAAYQDGYNSAELDHQDLQDIISDLRADLDAETAKYNIANANYLDYVSKYGEASEEAKTAKARVQELEKEVSNLEITLASYEAFKETVEAENKVTATFEYDGAVILLQSYDKGATITGVTVPEDTDEIKFNGWKVNGQAVDLSTYTISENTTFVADLTYSMYYTVTFKVDETEYNSQRVLSGSAITLPENPIKDGYEFKGWSIDGATVISVTTENISSSVEYIAVFEEVKPVELTGLDLVYEGDFGFGRFIWTDSENVYYSAFDVQYVLNKETLIWEEKTWYGRSSFYSHSVWTDGENIYCSIAEKQYVLNKETSTWEEKAWKGLSKINGDYIWTDGENVYYSSLEGYYVLNKETSIWEELPWNGLSEIIGDYIWTDGENVYYSYFSDQYVLNKETSTWEEKIWNGFSDFFGSNVWTDGENIYYSFEEEQYVLNKETSTWEEKTWYGFSELYRDCILTDGKNMYYIYGNIYKFV